MNNSRICLIVVYAVRVPLYERHIYQSVCIVYTMDLSAWNNYDADDFRNATLSPRRLLLWAFIAVWRSVMHKVANATQQLRIKRNSEVQIVQSNSFAC